MNVIGICHHPRWDSFPPVFFCRQFGREVRDANQRFRCFYTRTRLMCVRTIDASEVTWRTNQFASTSSGDRPPVRRTAFSTPSGFLGPFDRSPENHLAVCCPRSPEAILVDLQGPYLGLQRGSRHAEPGGRAGWSKHLSSAFPQGTLDHVFFLKGESAGKLTRIFGCRCRQFLRDPAFIGRKILCFAHDDRSLDNVLQFANISRPGVRLKKVQRLFIYPVKALSCSSCEMIDEVFNQQGDVFSSFPQGRNFNRKTLRR